MVIIEWPDGRHVHIKRDRLFRVTPDARRDVFAGLLDGFELPTHAGDPDMARADFLLQNMPGGSIVRWTPRRSRPPIDGIE